jgi:hypothetical protein
MDFSKEQILTYMEAKYGKRCPLGIALLDYFITQDLLKVSARFGRIVGVLIFRKLKLKDYDPRDLMKHNPKGDCAYVLELCADDTDAVVDLENQMRARLGKCRHLGMTRRKSVKFYNYDKFMDKLLGGKRI